MYDYTQHYIYFVLGVTEHVENFFRRPLRQVRVFPRESCPSNTSCYEKSGAISDTPAEKPYNRGRYKSRINQRTFRARADDFFDITCGSPLSFLVSRATPIPSTHVTSLLQQTATTYALDFICISSRVVSYCTFTVL